MIKQFVEKLLVEKFKHEPTSGQKKLIDKLSDFVLDIDQPEILLLKGYAGTGKTTIISAFINVLADVKISTVLLAPTGRAAKMLTQYSGKEAFTVHKKIYRQKASNDAFGEFMLDKNLHTNAIFIVDEASMISNQTNDISVFGSGKLLTDLVEYVFSGKKCKLILLGDTAQLPPIGLEISPALDQNYLEMFDFPVISHELTEVVRQSKESGILENATRLRKIIPEFNNFQFAPRFRLKNYDDIHKLENSELIEEISNSYSKNGIEDTIVICRTNKLANRYNLGIRSRILGKETEIAVGDHLMVVKNNYVYAEKIENVSFIANGDIVRISKIVKYEEMYGFRFADVKLEFIDYNNVEFFAKIMLDTLTIDAPALTSDDNKRLFMAVSEDYANIKSLKKRYKEVKENPYFNALQVKFAYAVTCHKSQGGQWHTVFVDQDFYKDDMMNVEYVRWLYTAVTRPKEKLFLVNFKENFFE